MPPLTRSHLSFGCHTARHEGKVRDIYSLEEHLLVFVTTDRISAFDRVFPEPIPRKGQVLNKLAAFFLQQTAGICRNHFIQSPHPNATVGLKVEPYPVEIIVRGHLCGHAWREYRGGNRQVCGVELPPDLRENDPLPEPIITPSTKSAFGPDIDITEEEILKSGIVPPDEYAQIKQRALALFRAGQEHARSRGLILADTKYEFGTKDFDIYLIDELHTPDSSRYFWAGGFEARQQAGEPQEELSKEYLRKWLIGQGFQGEEGKALPELPPAVVQEVSERYVQVYEQLTGEPFPAEDADTSDEAIVAAVRPVVTAHGLHC